MCVQMASTHRPCGWFLLAGLAGSSLRPGWRAADPPLGTGVMHVADMSRLRRGQRRYTVGDARALPRGRTGLEMDTQGKIRHCCSCGRRLARDNRGMACSACERRSEIDAGSPVVPPAFWLSDNMREAFSQHHMGKVIKAYRNHPFHARPISQATAARWAGVSQAQMSRTESGRPVRDLERLIHWANTLRIPQRLLWFDLAEHDGASGEYERSQSRQPTGGTEVSSSRRREIVALSGLAIAGQVAEVLEHELDMVHMTIDRGTTSEDRAAHFEQTARDLGIQAVQTTPMSVIRPTLGALRSIRSLLEQRQPTRQQVRLLRATAMLSTVAGDVLFNTGQFRRAHEWYKGAEHAAQDVGDRYLMDIALAGQAHLPTYSDDPRGVLTLIEPRLEGKALPTPAVSWLWAFKARAHAALGQAGEFQKAIHQSQGALSSSRPEQVTPGIFSFLPERLAFYEATGAVQLKMPETAVAAADRALSLYDPSETTEPTLARLERASALALAREIPQACNVAIEALLDPNTFHGVSVRRYAARFDGLVRGIQSPETRQWREVHAAKHLQRSRQPTH
jgi:transcriptional regulator with XRE-family HTH domain